MIRISQIEISIKLDQESSLLTKCSKILNISPKKIKIVKINKLSLDARKKPNLYYVYELDLEIPNEKQLLAKNKNKNIKKTPTEKYHFSITGTKDLKTRPVIIGAGPAGLFCAYILAENGYYPLIIERGEKTENRIKSVEKFWQTGILNPNSNVQFGEGGAGTFSDGKLNTLVKDPRNRQKKVLQIFVDCGAPKEILYLNKPHIGTDLLRKVIINLRKKIISMGGEFLYNTTLTDIIVKNNQLEAIELNNKKVISSNILILAIGHSARDTFEMLYKNKLNMQAKPFAVGIRIEHPQKMIDENQYGLENINILPKASYKLTYNTKDKRGVYTFCMCPGGYVVNSSSEVGHLAINGMSNYQRNTENANSAIIVTVSPKDFGENPLSGLAFQRNLEKKAYKAGLGKIPIQTYKDFKNNQKTKALGKIKPITMGEYNYSNLREIFPNYIIESLIAGIDYFDTKIKDFASDDAIISAVESRTSSPIRIERDNLGISSIKGIYPCGEGAGYAGGITSAAMDGILQAENIAKIYKKGTR